MSVVYSTVSISTVTDIQDYLLNFGATYVEPWKVEIMLYRANQASFGDEGKSQSLFTVWASHNAASIWSFGPHNTGVETSVAMRQILESKLQGLWTPRQTFKGEGHTYRVDSGAVIHLSNMLVQGNYKGLLMDADSAHDCQQLFKNIVSSFGLEEPGEEIVTDPRERARLYQKVYR